MHKLASYLVREGALPVADAVGWVVRLAAALEVIHRLGVAHGRVSSKAIQFLGPGCHTAGFLLDTDDLIDEPAYQSPERLDGGGESTEDDTWAAGVVLYEALTGKRPFVGSTARQVKSKITGPPRIPVSALGVDDDKLQTVVRRVLALDPVERITSLVALRAELIGWDASLEELPPLTLGKPDSALFEAAADDDEELTAVADLPPAIQQAREAARQKRAPPEIDRDARAAQRLVASISSIPPPPELPIVYPKNKRARTRTSRAPLPPPTAVPGAPAVPAMPAAPGLFDGDGGHASPSPPAAAVAPSTDVAVDEAGLFAEPKRPGRAKLLYPLLGTMALVGVVAFLIWGTDLLGADTDPGPDEARTGQTAVPPSSTAPSKLPVTTAPPPASAADLPPTTAVASQSASSPVPSQIPSATASAAATAAPPPANLVECTGSLFPTGTFAGASPKLEFLCTEDHARRGGTALKVEVIRASIDADGIPAAMQEYSKLGWYEMAVFALARGRCCSTPKPLATPLGLDMCPLDKALEQLGQAAAKGEQQAAIAAVDAYTKVVVCLVQAGASKAFGQGAAPSKISTDTFKAILTRALSGAQP